MSTTAASLTSMRPQCRCDVAYSSGSTSSPHDRWCRPSCSAICFMRSRATCSAGVSDGSSSHLPCQTTFTPNNNQATHDSELAV